MREIPFAVLLLIREPLDRNLAGNARDRANTCSKASDAAPCD